MKEEKVFISSFSVGYAEDFSYGRDEPILGNPGATSRDDAIFSSKRYFRARVYLKC